MGAPDIKVAPLPNPEPEILGKLLLHFHLRTLTVIIHLCMQHCLTIIMDFYDIDN